MKSFTMQITTSLLFIGFFSLNMNAQTIHSLKDVEINGLVQKILIQSEDISNSVLLFLHAGPGMTSMMNSHYYTETLKNTSSM